MKTNDGVCSLFSISTRAVAKSPLRDETVILGIISSNPQKAFKRAQPFAEVPARAVTVCPYV